MNRDICNIHIFSGENKSNFFDTCSIENPLSQDIFHIFSKFFRLHFFTTSFSPLTCQDGASRRNVKSAERHVTRQWWYLTCHEFNDVCIGISRETWLRDGLRLERDLFVITSGGLRLMRFWCLSPKMMPNNVVTKLDYNHCSRSE